MKDLLDITKWLLEKDIRAKNAASFLVALLSVAIFFLTWQNAAWLPGYSAVRGAWHRHCTLGRVSHCIPFDVPDLRRRREAFGAAGNGADRSGRRREAAECHTNEPSIH